jgi:hypothetical protein
MCAFKKYSTNSWFVKKTANIILNKIIHKSLWSNLGYVTLGLREIPVFTQITTKYQ